MMDGPGDVMPWMSGSGPKPVASDVVWRHKARGLGGDYRVTEEEHALDACPLCEAEGWPGEKASMKEAFQREYDQRVAAEAALREIAENPRSVAGSDTTIRDTALAYFDREEL
jgi:hypothetical protein